MVDEKNEELVKFILLRGMGFNTEEIEEQCDTVNSVLYSRRKAIQEKFISSDYDDITQFFTDEML